MNARDLEILREYERRITKAKHVPDLEEILCSDEYFGLRTATPVQRAICRVSQGVPLGGHLSSSREVLAAFGGVLPEPFQQPLEVMIIAAVRCAKSLFAAAVAVRAAMTCDMSLLRSGEIPRFSIVSLSKDNASVIHGHLVGALRAPGLRQLRVNEKQAKDWTEIIDDTASTVSKSEFLWHPSGRPVEICVVAGKRAGGSVVSRWSAGGVLDEAPRMVGGSDGVVNYDDIRKAIISRLLPGAQLLSIGSPWAPFGPVYNRTVSCFGKPTKTLVVIRASGPSMNPYWWTPERCAEIREADPVAARTDCDAEFADIEESLFPEALLDECKRSTGGDLPYERGHDYCAAIDPATRNNAWTLVVADKFRGRKRIVAHRQWIGSTVKPLRPRVVLAEVAEVCRKYGISILFSDKWSADANRDLAELEGLTLIDDSMNSEEQVKMYTSIAVRMASGEIEVPNSPEFLADFKMVRRMTTQTGVAISLVVTADGRHADYAPATMRALRRWIDDEESVSPEPNTPERADYEEMKREEEEERECRDGSKKPWWDK